MSFDCRYSEWDEYDEFDPFGYAVDLKKVGDNCIYQLPRQPLHRLDSLKPFPRTGVYAIHYIGKPLLYGLYGSSVTRVYTGQSSGGKRKGVGYIKTGDKEADDYATYLFLRQYDTLPSVYDRLNQHRKSIAAAKNLDLENFFCSFLLMNRIWVRAVEDLLIREFNPVWNVCLDGFGNNGVGGRGTEEER